MQCPKCQFDNPTGINYCGECGAKLEKLCPSCHSPNPPNFKFCGECGQNLTPAIEIFEKKPVFSGRPLNYNFHNLTS
jgi:predicted amidophosphoribosyltransferase